LLEIFSSLRVSEMGVNAGLMLIMTKIPVKYYRYLSNLAIIKNSANFKWVGYA